MTELEKLPLDDECDALLRVFERRRRRGARRIPQGQGMDEAALRAQKYEIQVMRQLFEIRYYGHEDGRTTLDIARGLREDV